MVSSLLPEGCHFQLARAGQARAARRRVATPRLRFGAHRPWFGPGAHLRFPGRAPPGRRM